jgi:hypothetical protein
VYDGSDDILIKHGRGSIYVQYSGGKERLGIESQFVVNLCNDNFNLIAMCIAYVWHYGLCAVMHCAKMSCQHMAWTLYLNSDRAQHVYNYATSPLIEGDLLGGS